MRTLNIRCYAELNDFLPAERQQRRFYYAIDRNASIKDVIEALGVPHTEVALILVNGLAVNFSYLVKHNDQIGVYPLFRTIQLSPFTRLRNKLLDHRFVLDSNLGRLARYLRLLGLDCLYHNNYQDAEVADIAAQQQRIVLTRDSVLLRRKIISHGYFVRSVQPKEQVKEVLRRFGLYSMLAPFTRCAKCNGVLSDVSKAQIEGRLEPLTRQFFDEFKVCNECGQIYWRGSHQDHSSRLISEFINSETKGQLS